VTFVCRVRRDYQVQQARVCESTPRGENGIYDSDT
jgi:hypothetical protein